MNFQTLFAFSLLLVVVLSSDRKIASKYGRFTSVRDKRDVWYFLALHEERIVEKLDTLVRKNKDEVEKQTDAILEDLKLNDKNTDVKEFVFSVKMNCSNSLTNIFNSKEFQGEDKHIHQTSEIIGFKEVALKAAGEYYLQFLPKILEHNAVIKGARTYIQNMILKFLRDHDGFGPSGVTYYKPNNEKRRKCEKKFDLLKNSVMKPTMDLFWSKITIWFAHRYLHADRTKLNTLAQGLQYTSSTKAIDTPFNKNDEKFLENLSLLFTIGIKEPHCTTRFTEAVRKELVSFVKSIGYYPMLDPVNLDTNCKVVSKGCFRLFYRSNPAAAIAINEDDCSVCLCLVFFVFLIFYAILGLLMPISGTIISKKHHKY